MSTLFVANPVTLGVVGCGEGVGYLTSPGRLVDIGLVGQGLLPLQEVRAEGKYFISSVTLFSFLFLFLPSPSLSFPLLSLISLFSFSLRDDIKKNDPKGLTRR